MSLVRILSPGVVWGQHRSTELIAMGVKNLLAADPDIQNSGVPFVEFEKYGLEDYVEVLHGAKAASARDKVQACDERFMARSYMELAKPAVDRYKKQLRDEHGPLMFNLHDGNKTASVDYDIEFWIPPYIREHKELGEYLVGVGRRHGLRISIVDEDPGKTVPHQQIGVEFMTPHPERRRFPSDDVRTLVQRFDPGRMNTFEYKSVDMGDPLYESTARKYAAFMKDALLGLRGRKFTEAK